MKGINYVVLVAQSYPALCDPMEPSRLLNPWNSLGMNVGVGNHSLLQGIFSTQICMHISPPSWTSLDTPMPSM